MQVCIVEQDAKLAGVLQQALKKNGSVATHLASGDHAASYIASHSFDAVVLALALPGTDGLAVLKQMRRTRCQTPVLILSAHDTIPEIVHALDAGADDYMTKPCHLDLFLARLRSISRRGAIPQSTALAVGPMTLQYGQRVVCLHEKFLDLTRREYMILEVLMRRAGQVVMRDQIAQAVWGYDADVSKGNLDFHMHSLRAKLGPTGAGMLRTVRGIGYVLRGKTTRA